MAQGFIILDLGTGKCWRRLTLHPSVLAVYNSVPSFNGKPFYVRGQKAQVRGLPEGVHGQALSANGEMLYYSPLSSSYLYGVPTAALRVRDEDNYYADWNASNQVQNLGQAGGVHSGFDSDTNNVVYMGAPESNAIYTYQPSVSPIVETLVRDPRLQYVDTLSIGFDGYLYGDVTQLFNESYWNNGTDLRTEPGFLFRTPLPNKGSKLLLQ